MSWAYTPGPYTSGSTPANWVNGTPPTLADFQAIAHDIQVWGGNVDAGAHGLANSAFIVLNPGALPGSPTTGMIAVNAGLNVQIWNGSSWVAATTSVAAGVWQVGSGVPSSGLGSNGDMYLNTVTDDIYGPKAAGAWGSIVANILGTPGVVWWSGSGAPSGALGKVGDFYLDISGTGNVYDKTGSSTWTLQTSLQGPAGSAVNPRGAYSAGTTYAQFDGVADAGLDYISLQSGNIGHTPASSPTFWQAVGTSSLADPGGNGIVKRTALNTTAVAVGADLPVMVASGGSHSGGAVPDPGSSAGTTKFLREDATFAVPPGVTVENSVLGSRLKDTVYQNLTGKPMYVAISVKIPSGTTGGFRLKIDSATTPTTFVGIVYFNYAVTNDVYGELFGIVLPNYYYWIQSQSGGGSVDSWTEWS